MDSDIGTKFELGAFRLQDALPNGVENGSAATDTQTGDGGL